MQYKFVYTARERRQLEQLGGDRPYNHTARSVIEGWLQSGEGATYPLDDARPLHELRLDPSRMSREIREGLSTIGISRRQCLRHALSWARGNRPTRPRLPECPPDWLGTVWRPGEARSLPPPHMLSIDRAYYRTLYECDPETYAHIPTLQWDDELPLYCDAQRFTAAARGDYRDVARARELWMLASPSDRQSAH